MPTAKRSSVKKTATRTTKKQAVAKRGVKKTVRKTAAAPKKTTKKVATKKSALKKVAKTYKPRKKNTINESFDRQTKNPFSFPTKVSLALIPAVNILPINPDALAIGLARYAGTAFLVIGGVFTLLYAHALGFSTFGITQLALVSDATSSTDTAEFVAGEHEFDEPGTASPHTLEPTVAFDIPVDGALAATVELVVSVEAAAAVTVHAFHRPTASHVTIGAAEQVADATWRLEWNTIDYPNGEYTLKATVINEFGSYHRSDNGVLVVENQSTNAEQVSNPDPSTGTDSGDQEATEETESQGSEPEEDGLVTEDGITDTTEPDGGTATDAVEGSNGAAGSDTTQIETQVETETETESEPESSDVVVEESVSDEVTETAVTNEDEAEDEPAENETETKTETKDTSTQDEVLLPETLIIKNPSATVAGFEALTLEAPAETRWVELYLASPQRDTQLYIGRANERASGDFALLWDSTNVPNGTYVLVAKAKVADAITLVESGRFTVANIDVVTGADSESGVNDEEQAAPKITPALATAIEQVAATEPVKVADTVPQQSPEEVAAALQKSDLFTGTDTPEIIATDERTAAEFSDQAKTLLRDNEDVINQKLQRLTTAVRVGDSEGAQRVQDDLEAAKNTLLATVDNASEAEKQALTAAVDEKLIDLQLRVEQTERLVQERTAGQAAKDSDGDGVSDIDEITLYKTDPQAADSDGDGFTDGAEVLSGFNPTDASPEAVVAFESPKEVGIVRPDLLAVTAVTPVTDKVDKAVPPAAVISGRGLANSFITLYIFSNPTVVTVKTDADGNWSYRFDKEIEDGEHEVYVGVTDNAGRIVAKSEPVRFVKTAEAFEPVASEDTTVVVAQTEQGSGNLVSTTMLLLVASISIAAIGLVLIILGLHLQNKRDEEIVTADVMPASAV